MSDFNNPTNFQERNSIFPDTKKRGLQVWSLTELVGTSAKTKDNKYMTATYQRPLFSLTPFEREELFRLNSFVFGVITSRMNRISTLDFSIERKKNILDKTEFQMKTARQLFTDYSGDNSLKATMVRQKAYNYIRQVMPAIKPDLSNFEGQWRLYAKAVRMETKESADEIYEWVSTPNSTENFDDFRKKLVNDLMVHGAIGAYKKYGVDQTGKRLQSVHMLPGGSVIPVRTKHVSEVNAYLQLIYGTTPGIYFKDEMIFQSYVPMSNRSYGLVPLDALINKVAESLLFDKYAAERADGTKPPEKIVLAGENSPFHNMNGQSISDQALPLDAEEQKRLETKLNEPRKEAVAVVSGQYGVFQVVDMSKSETFSAQAQRQEKLLKDIALVFNMSNMEVNLAGSGDTSGRSTSESQERIEREKGIYPIVRMIDRIYTSEIIPYRFGFGWELTHNTGLSDAEQIALDTKKLQSGSYSVNEIRVERGDDAYSESQFDRPQGQSEGEGQAAGQSELNPLFTKQI